MWACVDPVHVDLGVVRGGPPDTVRGVGPAVAFAQEMFRRTGVPQGILACAHGGTSMSQWDPKLKKLGGKSLYHGYGTDPFRNITDEADRMLPVFGPIPVGQLRARTPMITTWRVALPVDLPPGVDAKLNGLNPPADPAGLPWRKIEFPTRFCDLHLEIGPMKPRDFIVWYACRLDVPEPMKLGACLGYDGPVKLWLDGWAPFHEPNGAKPHR